MRQLSLVISSLCIQVAALPVWADTVQLHNGSVVHGTIQSITEGKLQIDTGYGNMMVPVRDVQSLDSDHSVWIRVKGEPMFSHGKLSSRRKGLQLTNAEGNVFNIEQTANVAELTTINPDKDLWRYSGYASVYFSLDRGNDERNSLSGDGRITARDRLNRHSLDFKSEREKVDDKTTKDRWLAKYNYNRFLNSSWYVLGNAGWEKNRMQSLDSRTSVGAGIGHQFWDEPDLSLKAELGISQLWEKYESGAEEDNQAIHWALNYDQMVWNGITLFHDQDVFYRLSSSSWLLQTGTGVRYKLTDLVHLSLRYGFDYDNDPQPGRKKEDSSLMFGLGASW